MQCMLLQAVSPFPYCAYSYCKHPGRGTSDAGAWIQNLECSFSIGVAWLYRYVIHDKETDFGEA